MYSTALRSLGCATHDSAAANSTVSCSLARVVLRVSLNDATKAPSNPPLYIPDAFLRPTKICNQPWKKERRRRLFSFLARTTRQHTQ